MVCAACLLQPIFVVTDNLLFYIHSAPFLDLVRSLGESFKPAEDSKESAEAKEKQVVEEGERSGVELSGQLCCWEWSLKKLKKITGSV